MKKFVVGFLLIVSSCFLGAVTVATLAVRTFMSAGLLESVTLLWFALSGALVGLILSIVALVQFNFKTKAIIAIVLFALSTLIFGYRHFRFAEHVKNQTSYLFTYYKLTNG